jgi:ankyrin repeat protein
MYVETLIVTRHSALVTFLREKYGITGTVVEHISKEDARSRNIIGNVPLHIAAYANAVATLELDIPRELRGVELTVEQIRQYSKGLEWYRVTHTDTGIEHFDIEEEIARQLDEDATNIESITKSMDGYT